MTPIQVVPDTRQPPSLAGVWARLVRGIAANTLGQILNTISRLALVPLFVHAWGIRAYGDWIVLSSAIAYLSLSDLGASTYITNRMTQLYTQGSAAEFRRTLHTGLALLLGLPTVALVLFLLLALSARPERILHISAGGHRAVFLLLALLALQFVLSLPYSLLLGTYRAVGMLPRSVMLANLVLVSQLVLTSSALLLRASMLTVAILQTVPLLLVGSLALHGLRAQFPRLALPSLSDADRKLAILFIRPSLQFFSINISYAALIQGTLIVAALVSGPSQVVLLSASRTLANTLRAGLGLVVHSAVPDLTRLDTLADAAALFVLFRNILRSTLVASFLCLTLIHLTGSYLYYFWLRGTVEFDPVLIDLTLLYVLESIFWQTVANFLMAVNAHSALSRVLLAGAAFTLLLCYLLGRRWGIHGVAAGSILGDICLPLWATPYLLHRRHPLFSLRFYASELTPVTLGIVATWLVPLTTPIILLLLIWWWTRTLPAGTPLLNKSLHPFP